MKRLLTAACRRLVAPLCTAMALLLLCACATEKSELEYYQREDGRIEVEFWHAMSGGLGRSVNELIDEYNASQDEYYVVGIFQGNYNSLSQKLIASLYGGRQPVITQVYESWTTRYLRYDCLQPVQTFIDRDPEFGDDDIADIPDAFILDNSYRMTKGPDGNWDVDPAGDYKLATLPFNKSVYLLFVNDTMMREKGFDEPPKTWDEMRTLARAMTDLDEDVYGFAARPFIETFTTVLFATGTNYMDEETGEFTFAGEEGLEALDFLRELVLGSDDSPRAGYVESAYLSAAFGTGRIGMYIGSTAAFPFNDSAVGNKFIWRAYPIPASSPDVEARALAQGTNIAILRKGFSDGSTIPMEVQEGAWDFLKFMTSTEPAAKFASATGYMPVRYSALETDLMKEYLERNVNYANAVAELDRAMFEPKPIWWDSIRTALNREVDSVLSGRKTPEEGLQDAMERARTVRETAGAI